MKDERSEGSVFSAVDFHSHMLPGVDDGSASAEESAIMLAQSFAQGVKKLLLSPHFYPTKTSPAHFLQAREQAYQKLLSVYNPEIHPELHLGAEVAFFYGIGRCEELQELTVDGGNYLLVEMPFCKWDKDVENDLLMVKQRLGLTPIIAHVERYMKGNEKIIKRLREKGVLIQSNAEFFLCKKQKKALHLLKTGTIDLLGSDAHNPESRKPNLGAAVTLIAEKLSPQTAEELFHFSSMLLQK